MPIPQPQLDSVRSGFTRNRSAMATTDLLLKNCNNSLPRVYLFGLSGVLITRVVSEGVNTFVWEKVNAIWGAGMVLWICAFIWPVLALMKKGQSSLFRDYISIWLYLLWLGARTILSEYSIKCFLAEFICWFMFIFTREICDRSPEIGNRYRRLTELIVRGVVVIGLGQLALYVAGTHDFNLSSIIENRPVRAIYAHQSICLILIFPFCYYFLKRREYLWVLAVSIAAMGTGSRSAFLAFVMLSFISLRMMREKPVRPIDLIVTFGIVAVTYGVIIAQNSGGWSWQDAESRTSMSTMRWRVAFWREILTSLNPYALLIGNGLGSADVMFGAAYETGIFPPHNDYIRLLYDSGVIGLVLFAGVIVTMLRILHKAVQREQAVYVNFYLTILIFSLTDNFIYSSNMLTLYMFLGCYPRDQSPPSRVPGGVALSPALSRIE